LSELGLQGIKNELPLDKRVVVVIKLLLSNKVACVSNTLLTKFTDDTGYTIFDLIDELFKFKLALSSQYIRELNITFLVVLYIVGIYGKLLKPK
jgi:hypothetical protein